MSAITDVKCVLTQEALDAFCNTFHILEEVHPVFPNQDDTMHERPAGKIRDPAPVMANFNAQDYATLVAHPSSFQKFSEAFLYLIGLSRHYTLDEETYPMFLHKDGEDMDLFAFSHALDPTKVRVVERERDEGEPRLLETTVGRIVLLLPVALDHAEIVEAANTIVEDVAPVQSRRHGKKKFVVVDTGGASHPPRKLKEDHETLSEATVGGFVSTMPEREDRDHTEFVDELNLNTIRAPRRSPALIITTVTTTTPTIDPTSVTKEKVVEPSLFGAGSSFAGGTDPIIGVFSNFTSSDFLSVTNGSRFDDGRVCREMVDEFAPSKFFASVRGMEHDQLFTEFNVRAARQMSLSAEVRMRVEYNVKEKRRLNSVVKSQGELLKAREKEIESLKARLLLKEAKAGEAIRLRTKAFNFETIEKSLWDEANALRERNVILEKEQDALDVKVTELEISAMSKERELIDLNALITSIKSQNDSLLGQVEKFQDDRMQIVGDKFVKLYTDFDEMSLYLEEQFYPHLLTTISGHKWLLIHVIELAIAKCLNSPEYLSALGTAIGKAIKKGMQDGLVAGITHGKEGRVLMDVAAHNPSAKADYISALQQLQTINFPLSVNSPNKVVTSITTLSLALDASSSMVWWIRENIANHKSVLLDVFDSLAEPFFTSALTGVEGTSGTVPAIATTTTLSSTLASTSTVNPIFMDDYEFIDADDKPFLVGMLLPFPMWTMQNCISLSDFFFSLLACLSF
nr:hypothetical protein [Tanacetum cinerariifolium]